MITEEQRLAIVAIKDMAIAIGKAVHAVRRDHGIDVRMCINKNSVIVNQVFILQEVTREMLEDKSAEARAAVEAHFNPREKARAEGLQAGTNIFDAIDQFVVQEKLTTEEICEHFKVPMPDPNDHGMPAISEHRPNKGMAKAINEGVANAKPVDPKQAADDVAYAQGYNAPADGANPYSSFRNAELHAKWAEGFIAAHS